MPLLEILPCYEMNIWVPLAPIHMLNPYYLIWRWGLWELIRKGEWSPNNGISVPIRTEVAPSPCALLGSFYVPHEEIQEEGAHPILPFPTSIIMRTNFLLFINPSSVVFVLPALGD